MFTHQQVLDNPPLVMLVRPYQTTHQMMTSDPSFQIHLGRSEIREHFIQYEIHVHELKHTHN